MSRQRIVGILMPSGAAAITAFGAQIGWQEPQITILAGAAGAALGALLFGARQNQNLTPKAPEPDVSALPVPVAPTPKSDALPVGVGRVLLEHMPVGFILIDRDRQVQLINSEARSYFGRGQKGSFQISTFRAPQLLEAIERVIEMGGYEVTRFSLPRAETIHLRAHIRDLTREPLFAGMEGEPAVLVMIEDQTEANRAAMLRRDFIANASHELKTPLAAISGIIETLLGHAKEDPEATERFLNLMGRQTERMKTLVRDLLSLNRIEINERVQPREAQHMGDIVADATDVLTQLANAYGIELESAPISPPDLVLGDREELTQVFVNLIENAIKYGREGSPVRIRQVDGMAQRHGQIGIAVHDQGLGIAREHLPRLTERFYRVSVSRSREKGGTGLGLAIVKHIVNRHRGELTIESEIGQGSCFTVWLPLAPEDAQSRAPVDTGNTHADEQDDLRDRAACSPAS